MAESPSKMFGINKVSDQNEFIFLFYFLVINSSKTVYKYLYNTLTVQSRVNLTITYYADTPCFKPGDETYNLTDKIPFCNQTTKRMVTNIDKYENRNEIRYNNQASVTSRMSIILAYTHAIIAFFAI